MKGALARLMKFIRATFPVWFFTGLLIISPALATEPSFVAEPEAVRVYPGAPFFVTYTLRWDGEADACQAPPLTLGSIDWGNARLIETSASGEEVGYYVVQRVEVVANTPGEYKLPAVTISLQPKGDSSAKIELTAGPVAVSVHPDYRVWWLAGTVLGLGLLGAATVLLARRRRAQPAGIQVTPVQKAQAALHLARRNRLDGRYYEFYLALAEAAQALAGNGADENPEPAMRQRAQAVGYQGLRPTDDEMDSALRDVERLLRHAKEETKE